MKTRIGFIYYTFFPVTGGASVHGYNLARELNNLGYELWKLNGRPDPWTVKQPRGPMGLIRLLRHCDIIYVRMDYFLNFRNLIAITALLTGKRVVAELNMPSDELHLFGRSRRYIRMIDRIYRSILGRADAVIVVSPGIDTWCRTELGLTNTHIIENGGERFDDEPIGGESRNVSAPEQQIATIRKQFETVIVWSGSANEMQDMEWLRQIGDTLEPDQALILALFDTGETSTGLPGKENVFQFRNPSRESVRQMIRNADIGLAFYNSYPWSRWGFYNSPLKIHEYLVNGLLAITNIDGSPVLKAHPLYRQAGSVGDVQAFIRGHRKAEAGRSQPSGTAHTSELSDQSAQRDPETVAGQTQSAASPADAASSVRPAKGRTWADVAAETDRVIRQVLSRKNR